MQYAIILFIGLFFPVSVSADWKEGAQELWNKTKKTTGEQWGAAKQITRDSLERNKEYREQLTTDDRRHIDYIWEDVIEELMEALDILNRMESAPNSAWIRADKKSLTNDFHDALDNLYMLLVDEDVRKYRDLITYLDQKISSAEARIVVLREKRVGAPREAMASKTKSDYDAKIKDQKQIIMDLKTERIGVISKIQDVFSNMGVYLEVEQIKVLLVRVDGTSIMQMIALMDASKDVTGQLLQLVAESGEELQYAKKYYGMHMVVLKLVVYVQTRYIDDVGEIYLPKLNEIAGETKKLKNTAKVAIARENDARRIDIYEKNIEAQDMTLRTSALYFKNLEKQQSKVKKARDIAIKDLYLARNTYKTVVVSSQLFYLMKESEDIFALVMNIQVPEIVPFQNAAIKRKYEEISDQMMQ